MQIRFLLAIGLTALTQTSLTATTTYTFGSSNNISLETNSYTAGNFTENNSTDIQNIVCVVALANTTHVCGNPGPTAAVNIPLSGEPSTASLPGSVTNYLMEDADPQYGAPISVNMTSLTLGDVYQISFYQASNEEAPLDRPYNDSWYVYVLPGASGGVYMCPFNYCSTVTNPDPDDGVFTSATMVNTGATTTPWTQQTFTFIATNTSEVLEFVSNAIVQTSGGFEPPLLSLADVSLTDQGAAPEPGTWVTTVFGVGFIAVAAALRRRSKTR